MKNQVSEIKKGSEILRLKFNDKLVCEGIREYQFTTQRSITGKLLKAPVTETRVDYIFRYENEPSFTYTYSVDSLEHHLGEFQIINN